MINKHDKFFQQLKKTREEYFPNISLSRLMVQFLRWLNNTRGIDDYSILDDDTLINYLQEFTEENV